MQIACPNCATTYQVADASLGAAGRSVRCVRCRNVWFAANPAALATISRDHRSDVAAFTASTTIAGIIAEPPEPPPEPEYQPAAEAPAYAEPVEIGIAGYAEEAPESDIPAEQPAEEPAYAEAQDGIATEPAELIEHSALAPIDGVPHLPEAAPGEDIESLASQIVRRQARRKRQRWSMPGVSTAILTLFAINMALIGWRSDVVRWAPQTAALYAAIGFPVNLRGLVFSNVKTEKETSDGVQVLVVEGTITSVARRAVEVPRLRFAMRNQNGNEIYTWTALPTRSVLPPGEILTFRSRLASPPREGEEVLVRFFNRRDLVAGIQ